MSVIPPVFGQRLSIRVARVFVIALIFVCTGTLIQCVLAAMLSGVLWGEPWWPLEIFAIWAARAALTGVAAGIYDATYDRVGARAVFVISLVMVLAFLIPVLGNFASDFVGALGHDTAAYYIIFLLAAVIARTIPTAVFLACFVVSMMGCWKLIDAVRDRVPAVWSVLPP